ncbi:SDR family NAD(P)-dependent oxidoreductase [Novosphingobium sp. G106]|nr:SDR family NAD(P)-dependent oxidoreductase [Novosphingobium sp. G106]MBV1688403.1 SDR family NAD(P)-dependent oxidoreductase [Novosphingobium sp. G106]
MKTLEGKVALVTGSGRGIGREIALRLAQDGASIIAHYSGSREGAEAVVAEITANGGSAVAYQADIARRDDIVRMFEEIDKDPGVLDIVVNNSGIMTVESFGTLSEETVQSIFGVNVFGPLYIVDEAIRRMRDGGPHHQFQLQRREVPPGGCRPLFCREKGDRELHRELGARFGTAQHHRERDRAWRGQPGHDGCQPAVPPGYGSRLAIQTDRQGK